MADVDLTPTAEMARNAERGLELRREHGRGGTEVGVARARDISNGKGLSPETVRRMHAFFSRHAKNKAGGEDDAGYIAWMLWGGDEGRDWASRKVDALDRKESNAMSETRKAIMERLGMAATNDRPGAKAKMGMRDTKGRGPFTLQYMASGLYGEPTWLLVDKAGKTVAKEHNEQSAKEMLRKANAGEPVYVSSRPGAKAKMGAPDPTRVADAFTPAQRAEKGRYLTAMYKLSAKAAVLASDLRNLSDRAQQYAKMLASEGVVTQELGRRMDEMLDSFRPYGKIPMSRPGAKVRAALADACWEGYEAVGTKPQDGKTVPNCVPKATAAKPAEDDLEREDVKAGLKLMAASDPAVSDKIRTLIKEGKPQEQAVAIALDMKRRGEL